MNVLHLATSSCRCLAVAMVAAKEKINTRSVTHLKNLQVYFGSMTLL